MGSSQIISGSGVGLGLGTKVDVAVGGTEVAGNEVEVGVSVGVDATGAWQEPSKILISTKMLTKLNGFDLQQGELSIHPPKQVIFHPVVL